MIRLIFLFLGLCFAFECSASVVDSQKITLAYTSLTFSRTTLTRVRTHNPNLGIGAEYAAFLSPDVSVAGHFVINMESQKVIMNGGGGGIVWYFVGGSPMKYEDSYVFSLSNPIVHGYVWGGMEQRTFNFDLYQQRESELPQNKGKSYTPDGPQDADKGSFLAPVYGAGAEIPLGSASTLGGRMLMFQSFDSGSIPKISGQELWVSVGFVF